MSQIVLLINHPQEENKPSLPHECISKLSCINVATNRTALCQYYSPVMVLPKLRGCCDSCTRSKLKCSGERPCCQRCRLRGQDCIYSKARRAGRPRLKANKANKPSVTASINHAPQTSFISYSNHPASTPRCSDSELPLPPPQEPTLPSPDLHDIASWMQDTWNQRASLSLEFTQASNVSELDDLILRDILWSNTEGFNSLPSGNMGLEWNRENVPLTGVLGDASLDHGITTGRQPSQDSGNPSSVHSSTAQESDHSSDPLTEIDTEINAIIASITQIAEQPMTSNHVHENICTTSWPQLLSKAQLLMYIAGAGGSESQSSLRLDAVLHVSWTAEQVQKRVSECATCKSREMEISSMLALMYDWITPRIAYALENPAVIQSCRLIIGNSVLTGQKGIISVYELVKYRTTRAMHVIENMKSRIMSIGQRDPDKLYQVAQLMFQGVESRLEALSGMIDLLASEHS